jgi:hypothetical protein
MKRLALCLCVAGILSGCAAKKPIGEISSFRNCRVTEKNPDGTLASCTCGKFTLGTDAKTGKNVALCSGK